MRPNSDRQSQASKAKGKEPGSGKESTNGKPKRKRTTSGYSVQILSPDGKIVAQVKVNGKPSAGNVHRGLREFFETTGMTYQVNTAINHKF